MLWIFRSFSFNFVFCLTLQKYFKMKFRTFRFTGEKSRFQNKKVSYFYETFKMYVIRWILLRGVPVLDSFVKMRIQLIKVHHSFFNPLNIFSSTTMVLEIETSLAVKTPNTGRPSLEIMLLLIFAGGTLKSPPVRPWFTIW